MATSGSSQQVVGWMLAHSIACYADQLLSNGFYSRVHRWFLLVTLTTRVFVLLCMARPQVHPCLQ